MVQTLESLRRYIREQIATVAVSDAQTQAETSRMLEYLTGRSSADVYAHGSEPVSEGVQLQARQLVEARVEKRIPIQYLLHGASFYGLELYVNSHVLIPRPETEILVEKALEYCNAFRESRGRYPKTLDLCTGSGAIALALSHELGPEAEITATDISRIALKVAQINQKTLGTHVNFKAGDLFEPVRDERFDLILCNPPYIDPALKPTLAPEVLDREPHLALFSDEGDAFSFYRRLAKEAPSHLNPDAHLLMETGQGMAQGLAELFERQGFRLGRIIPDYAGIDRHVEVVRS